MPAGQLRLGQLQRRHGCCTDASVSSSHPKPDQSLVAANSVRGTVDCTQNPTAPHGFTNFSRTGRADILQVQGSIDHPLKFIGCIVSNEHLICGASDSQGVSRTDRSTSTQAVDRNQ